VHRTPSILKRYQIIAMDDLQAAPMNDSSYAGERARSLPSAKPQSAPIACVAELAER
jgi:hypothetical protein